MSHVDLEPASSDGDTHRQQHVTFSPSTPTKGSGGLGSPTLPASQRKPASRGGTRRLGVDEQGQYTYKKTPSNTLMNSLQLGLQHSIGSIAPKPHRDILMTDFEVIETVDFPAAGSVNTPAHKYKDFTFKTYCPEAMRFFREAFGILPEDFMLAMCDQPLREVGNPGASGSLFYLSADDAFIIKTVQKKEARFLQKLLPGYYLNLTQNKRTLLPKFFGLYRYKSGSVNIRIVVMNNLLPSSIRYHEKYDLKGSTYKRKANSSELKKRSPTYKDLDFVEKHEEGITLAPEKYEALLHSVERDCKVLESFGIMDYSLLLGIHNIDQAIREKAEAVLSSGVLEMSANAPIPSRIELSKNFSIVSAEDIPALLAEEQEQRHHYPEGYIQGRIHGDRVMFYLGIIDILQSYRLKKKLEHGLKAVIADGATVSVHNPSFYARRFQDFMTTQVFKKDKTKYRTRKNSTNAQLRGRNRQPAHLNLGAGGGGAGKASPLDRQNSRDSKPTSPLHDPPSYNQAMKGTGVVLSPSYVMRSRSLSESVSSSSRSGHSTVPTLVTRPLKLQDSKDSATGVSPLSSSQSHKIQQAQGGGAQGGAAAKSSPKPRQEESPSGVAQSNRIVQDDGQSRIRAQTEPGTQADSTGAIGSDFELLRVRESDEGEFARHVRGTSTPIDVSISVEVSQEDRANDHLGGEEQVGCLADGSDGREKRGSLRREDAFEATEGGHTQSKENVEGEGLSETS